MKRTSIQACGAVRSLGVGMIAGLVWVWLLISAVPLAAAPLRQALNRVYITDVRDVMFVVSWTTDEASDGYVDWGTMPGSWTTTSDPAGDTTTHHVTISGLSPETSYYFQVRSGGETDTNGGVYYSVTTGPSPTPDPPGKQIWGYVYNSLGTAVPNAIVYVQIQGGVGNSQWVSSRTDLSGVWYYDVTNIRVADASAYYPEVDGTDNLRLVVQGGILGCVGENGNERIFSLPTTYGLPARYDTTLDAAPTAVTLTRLENQNTALFSGLSMLATGTCAMAGLVVLCSRKNCERLMKNGV